MSRLRHRLESLSFILCHTRKYQQRSRNTGGGHGMTTKVGKFVLPIIARHAIRTFVNISVVLFAILVRLTSSSLLRSALFAYYKFSHAQKEPCSCVALRLCRHVDGGKSASKGRTIPFRAPNFFAYLPLWIGQ